MYSRYESRFGVLAGYLPQDAGKLGPWLAETVARAKQEGNSPEGYSPSVRAMADLLRKDGVTRMYVTEMITQVPPEHRSGIETPEEMLAALDHIVGYAPAYSDASHFPMSALFVHMMDTVAGSAAFRYPPFNESVRGVLQAWCDFLDSPDSRSVLTIEPGGWLSPDAYQTLDLEEFIIPDPAAPYGGFASYNAFFHRQIKSECRPVAEPENPKVIVSANDGTAYRLARNVKLEDQFWIKSQPYSMENMLDSSPFTQRFVGGDVFQSFLSGNDYHRWRAPIAGTIREARVINGLLFSELLVMGYDEQAGVLSQCYQASVNTRGLVVIESDDPALGMVCVIPIGITEVSSVTLGEKIKPGNRVEKGEELGMFSYGGSSMCLVFQPGAVKEFTIDIPDKCGNATSGSSIKVSGPIALAE